LLTRRSASALGIRHGQANRATNASQRFAFVCLSINVFSSGGFRLPNRPAGPDIGPPSLTEEQREAPQGHDQCVPCCREDKCTARRVPGRPGAVLGSASGRSQTSGDGGRAYALGFSAGRGSDLRIGLFEPWCPMRGSDPHIRSTSAGSSRATQPMHRPRRFAASCIVRISPMDTSSLCIAAGPALPLTTGYPPQPNTRRARMFQRHATTRHIAALRSPPSHATVPSTDRKSAPLALYTMFVNSNVG
jgi:hypothetical protein